MSNHLLFVVTEDSFFCSHRLPLARAAKQAGYRVTVATCFDHHAEAIRCEGFELVPMTLGRGGFNPIRESLGVLRLARLYRRLRPDLIHHIAFKPIVLGSMAAKLAGIPAVVNTFTGLGYMYSSSDTRAQVLRGLVEAALRVSLGGRGRRVTVQNPDDRRTLARMLGIASESITLIRGSGVNPAHYPATAEIEGDSQVAFVGRMLWSKGVGDFVAAAEILKHELPGTRFVLAGGVDAENPEAVPQKRLESWNAAGIVSWLGKVEDISDLLSRSHVIALPSTYGEGVPKALIEAAASGRAIVTTDTPGCREIVRDGVNGLLVAPHDRRGLAEALRRLVLEPKTRRAMGEAGRRLVQDEFSERRVIDETLAVYRSVLTEVGREVAR